MTYHVRVLARARQDFDAVIDYIAERSPEGAARLVARFEEALDRLERNPFLARLAPESDELGEELRHILFRASDSNGAKSNELGPSTWILCVGASQNPSRAI